MLCLGLRPPILCVELCYGLEGYLQWWGDAVTCVTIPALQPRPCFPWKGGSGKEGLNLFFRDCSLL